jgi:hypothetical protein
MTSVPCCGPRRLPSGRPEAGRPGRTSGSSSCCLVSGIPGCLSRRAGGPAPPRYVVTHPAGTALRIMVRPRGPECLAGLAVPPQAAAGTAGRGDGGGRGGRRTRSRPAGGERLPGPTAIQAVHGAREHRPRRAGRRARHGDGGGREHQAHLRRQARRLDGLEHGEYRRRPAGMGLGAIHHRRPGRLRPAALPPAIRRRPPRGAAPGRGGQLRQRRGGHARAPGCAGR